MKIYYKVVVVSDKKYNSFLRVAVGAIQYKINRWVYPPSIFAMNNYGLCIFDTLVHAHTFLAKYEYPNYIKVFTCRTGAVWKPTVPCLAHYYILDGHIKPGGPSSPIEWPVGTLMADRVMLLKKCEVCGVQ